MSDHLTHPHPERIEQLRAQTSLGQAHWAGTGPEATYCTTCIFAKWNGRYKDRRRSGALKPITCAKYTAMMDGSAPRFEHTQRSCRFYEGGGGIPEDKKNG